MNIFCLWQNFIKRKFARTLCKALKIKFKVLQTSGHTAGSVCYIAENNIFSGDTLFKGNKSERPHWKIRLLRQHGQNDRALTARRQALSSNSKPQWTGDIDSEFVAGIRIVADNYEGLTADVIAELAVMHLAMTQINGRINKACAANMVKMTVR